MPAQNKVNTQTGTLRNVGSRHALHLTQANFEDITLNKSELVQLVADQADISKAAAGDAIDALLGGVTKALKKGDSVTFVGFGTFSVGKRAARDGRNPQTGEKIRIKASKNAKFKAGKALKDALN